MVDFFCSLHTYKDIFIFCSEEMSKQNIFFLIIGILLVILSSFLYYTYAAQGVITFEITWVGLRHGTPENFPISTVTSSPSDQEISGQFTQSFRVEDIEGYATGHYTTIQCAGIRGPYDTVLTWVELMAGNPVPELLMWTTGPNVSINPSLTTYTNIIEPITYIYKDTNLNNIWIVNKYGDKPWIKILIPAGTPPGTYSGTIVFSFYME